MNGLCKDPLGAGSRNLDNVISYSNELSGAGLYKVYPEGILKSKFLSAPFVYIRFIPQGY